MILLKFLFWIAVFWVALFLFVKIIGPFLSRILLKQLIKRAQKDMDRQSRTYQQHAEGHSPFEESVYIEDDVKVSIKRGQKQESQKKPGFQDGKIEEVDYEDIE